jgi:hypothetical protein
MLHLRALQLLLVYLWILQGVLPTHSRPALAQGASAQVLTALDQEQDTSISVSQDQDSLQHHKHRCKPENVCPLARLDLYRMFLTITCI